MVQTLASTTIRYIQALGLIRAKLVLIGTEEAYELVRFIDKTLIEEK